MEHAWFSNGRSSTSHLAFLVRAPHIVVRAALKNGLRDLCSKSVFCVGHTLVERFSSLCLCGCSERRGIGDSDGSANCDD